MKGKLVSAPAACAALVAVRVCLDVTDNPECPAIWEALASPVAMDHQDRRENAAAMDVNSLADLDLRWRSALDHLRHALFRATEESADLRDRREMQAKTARLARLAQLDPRDARDCKARPASREIRAHKASLALRAKTRR